MSVTVTVPGALAGERVDRAVALLLGMSRREVERLCEAAEILVDGRPVAKSRRLAEGETLTAPESPPGAAGPEGEEMDLALVHVDADVVVVDKPAGLVVHPGAGHESGTLVNGLLARFPEMAGVGDPARPGIVHRLDRDTSGLMVVARTQRAHGALVAALGERRVGREYAALVWGHPEPRGLVDAPIGRSVSRRTRMAVRDDGRPARTRYEVRRAYPLPPVALLDVVLESGRTHQIRVHLSAIGHPVVGDRSYGGARPAIPIDRPFLHAVRLRFAHPVTGEECRYESALPAELAAVLEALGALETPAG